MKKLMILSAIAVSGLIAQSAKAQIGIHISLHLGGSPVYVEPAPVYNDDYYYLPDVEAYYSVRENCYYYNDGYNWVSAAYLPGAYRDYDWRYARRVEIREPRPYLHSEVYRSRYGGAEHRDWNYRDGRDSRMYADRDHDNHENYVRPQEQHYDYNANRGQQQMQQNNNRGNGWNNRGQQQAQPQQNNYGNNNAQQHFADNRTNEQQRNRPVRF